MLISDVGYSQLLLRSSLTLQHWFHFPSLLTRVGFDVYPLSAGPLVTNRAMHWQESDDMVCIMTQGI